jgi:hypothetical protein
MDNFDYVCKYLAENKLNQYKADFKLKKFEMTKVI